MSTIFSYGLSSPSGGPRCCCDSCAKKGLPCCRRLRHLRRHRHHRRRCCFCCAAAELLLCCCCCHIRVPLLRVPKKVCCASRCQSIFPFFDTRLFVFFGDLMGFWRFAHRKHSQSDAGMNLAFFKFDIIIGGIILSQTLYLSFFIMERRYRNLHCEFLKLDQ